MDTEVLIVGAGPTGLMLANQLGRRGVRAVIVDSSDGPARQTRAMAVQARTLEIYAAAGLAERALALGQRGNAASMWSSGRRMARIPIGEIGKDVSPFPYVLMLGQDQNERILGEELGRWGMQVQWDTQLVSLQQSSSQVTARVKRKDGSEAEIRAAYVAGCDGGRSTVRTLCDIDFPGAPYEHVFFVADTEATGPMTPGELNVYLWRDGFHLFFPMQGADRWRVIGILPKALRDRGNNEFGELIPELRREVGGGLSFHTCSWFSTYRIHHRRAERFRADRCFLLGDAAHVHSPAGGQGMNTGLQDAYNLAWKVALVLGGKADVALLDSYEAERIPVAQKLLETTDRAFSLLVSEGRLAALFRKRIVARIIATAMRFERVRNAAFRAISQTGIRYRRSPLSRTLPGVPAHGPQAGDRMPWMRLARATGGALDDFYRQLDDTRFNLVLVDQAAVSDIAWKRDETFNVISVPGEGANGRELARVGIAAPAFYLVRPDGYIGLAGTRVDPEAVAQYLDACGIRARPSIARGGPEGVSTGRDSLGGTIGSPCAGRVRAANGSNTWEA